MPLQTPQRNHPVRIIRIAETRKRVGISAMQLMRMEAAGIFPKRVKLSPAGGKYGSAGHFEDEVEAFIESRRAARDQAIAA